MRLQGHAGRIAALTVIGTAIVLPLVVFVLGPNMPPGNHTNVASAQVNDNTVLLVVMTPFTVFILVYLAYAVFVFRAPKGEELRDGPPIRGHMPSQIAWLVVTRYPSPACRTDVTFTPVRTGAPETLAKCSMNSITSPTVR